MKVYDIITPSNWTRYSVVANSMAEAEQAFLEKYPYTRRTRHARNR